VGGDWLRCPALVASACSVATASSMTGLGPATVMPSPPHERDYDGIHLRGCDGGWERGQGQQWGQHRGEGVQPRWPVKRGLVVMMYRGADLQSCVPACAKRLCSSTSRRLVLQTAMVTPAHQPHGAPPQ
jgi:hypothetical protein